MGLVVDLVRAGRHAACFFVGVRGVVLHESWDSAQLATHPVDFVLHVSILTTREQVAGHVTICAVERDLGGANLRLRSLSFSLSLSDGGLQFFHLFVDIGIDVLGEFDCKQLSLIHI